MSRSRESMGLGGPATPGLADDWPAQAADLVERAVGTVRDKAVVPIEKVARIAVYGVLAAVLGALAVVLVAIGAVRLLDVVIPGGVWAAHAVVGGIFTIAGGFIWSKRRADPRRE